MALKKKYAIVDIETTGGLYKRDRITEIAIVLHDGTKIVDQFDSLVNPERSIPPQITRITGITDQMVQDAPKFFEIAKEVVELTEGCIFVAHNVRFDYSFIKEEFKSLGYTYTRRQLCTVKLSRKTFPGLKSYRLGNLIKHFQIEVENRHRALDDALATATIFTKISQLKRSASAFKLLINHGIKETQLPKHLEMEKLHSLPEETGVYYFHNEHGDVIYVGKAKNIKTRVFQHFHKISTKAAHLYHKVHDISFEITGSELVALLLETREIKAIHPEINKTQKKKKYQYFLSTYQDEEGYLRFDIFKNNIKLREKYEIIHEYSKLKFARFHLEQLIQDHELCHKRTFFSNQSNFHCTCMGNCAEEDKESYNEKVMEVKQSVDHLFPEDFFIIDAGRSHDEYSIVLIEDGKYRGFGYISKDDAGESIENLKDFVMHEPFYTYMNRLIWTQLKTEKYQLIQCS